MKKVLMVLAGLCVSATVCKADPVPFGVASAYNLVALGTVDAQGNVLLAGTISTSADVTGRVAAADQVLTGTTIGSGLNADPYGSLATFGLVAANGLGAGQTFQMNDGGTRVTSGSSGIDFTGLRTALDGETAALNGLTATGVTGAPTPAGGNPSWLVLAGTSSTLNIFDLTAAQFADANHNIDIEAPVGSTIIVNVDGVNVTLGAGLYYNGQQISGDNPADADILFNFAGAQTVAIDAQFSASLLAPYAVLTGTGQMAGNFIAAQIGQTGEVHNVEFTGVLPTDPGGPKGPGDPAVVPEPGTLAMVGTGMLGLAAMLRRRVQV